MYDLASDFILFDVVCVSIVPFVYFSWLIEHHFVFVVKRRCPCVSCSSAYLRINAFYNRPSLPSFQPCLQSKSYQKVDLSVLLSGHVIQD